MSEFANLAKTIIENVGGKENIISVVHCVTRLRFTLRDESKANDAVLKNTDGVLSILHSGGQYQIVIGNTVVEVYEEVCRQLGIEEQAEVPADDADTSNKNVLEKVLDVVSFVFTPVLPILCASGIIKGLLILLNFLNIIPNTSSFYTLFNAMGDAMFYFFPIYLGYTSAQKFGLRPMTGIAIGTILCYPAINGAEMNFFGYTMTVTYTSTVLPVIVLCAFAAPVEKYLDKHLPAAIRSFTSPMLTILLIVTLGYIIIGPIVNTVANYLSKILMAIFNFNPIIAGALIAGFWQYVVSFGVHAPFMMMLIMNIIGGTPDPLYAVVSVCSFGIMGATIAVWLKTKNQKLKSVALSSWITAICGITEPALYGVLLPNFKTMITSQVACAVGGALMGIFGVKAYRLAGMGIFRIPAFIVEGNVAKSVITVVAVYAITVLAGAILTFFVYKDEE